MDNDSYLDDFYEDDDSYYDDLVYDDDYSYDEYEYDDIERENPLENDEYEEYEDEEEKEYSNKGIYLKHNIKAIICIILIFLVLIILLLFFRSAKNKKVNKPSNDGIKVIKKVSTNSTTMFTKVKNASLNYFTEERFRNENTVSLAKLKELDLIKDIDNKYDLEKSKATISNNKLKISLVSNEKTESRSYNVGRYIYCNDTYYCEKSSTLESKTYEYSKEGDKKLSDWSNWSDEEETSCDINEITCDEDDLNCLTEVKTSMVEVNDDMIYQTSRNAFRTIEKEIKQVCRNYDYIKINGIYYRTEKDSNFKVLGAIKKDTRSSYFNWKYNGRVKYHTPPSDTINTRYVFVNEDYSNCKETCSDHPDYYYDSYTFTKQLVQVLNTTNDCNSYVTKVIPNYLIEQQKITVSRKEKYKYCSKSIRTRNIVVGEDIIKWSNYEDKELLNEGYNYTGKYK